MTISDRAHGGIYEDLSGAILVESLEAEGSRVLGKDIVPDELEAISESLKKWSAEGAELILTTGGTGVSPRDVTPEATKAICDRLVPGIAEVLRAESLAKTPYAALSRGVAGVIGTSLVVNLPGSQAACKDGFKTIASIGAHAVAQIKGEGHH